MGLLDTLSTWTTVLLFFAPLLLPRLSALLAFFARLASRSSAVPTADRPPTRRAPWSTAELALVVLHTAYHFVQLARWERDVFQKTSLPVFAAPISRVRTALGQLQLARTAAAAGADATALLHTAPDLPASTTLLLERLQSFDARAFYVKYGPAPLVACEWCDVGREAHWWAFWAAALALAYAAEGACWAAWTEDRGRRRWRTLGSWVIGGAAVGEAVWTFATRVQTPTGDGVHVFSTASLLRPLVFLSLPFLLYLLPPAQPAAPQTLLHTLPTLLTSAQHTLSHLKLLESAHSAVLRHPGLRARAAEVGEAMALEGQWAREDARVKEAGEKVGLTGEEGVQGGLREGARAFLQQGRQRISETLKTDLH